MNKLASIAVFMFVLIYFLIAAKGVLVPIILAIVIWYLINALEELLSLIPFIKKAIPVKLRLFIAFLIFIVFSISLSSILTQNINGILRNSSNYVINLQFQLERILSIFGIIHELDISKTISDINIEDYLSQFISSISLIAQRITLILLYVIFLLIEQHTIPRKIASLRMSDENKQKLSEILSSTNLAIRRYLGVKFLASLTTAILSFIVLTAVGLPFAFFWAFFIFLLNFIPTIGSIIATILPSLIALVEFESLQPFTIILIGVGCIQVLIGSFLEPRFYGASLNLSPFIILVSLVVWGAIWGIVGMLLCIPITVALMIVFSKFASTRPMAVLLSQKGRVAN